MVPPEPTIAPPPMDSKPIRLTISVTPEVHAAFSRLAAAGSTSLGRTMGEWLGDTMDAAVHVAELMERARQAPGLVARQLHSYAQGLEDETATFLDTVRRQARQAPAPAAPAQRGRPEGVPAGDTPPYVIRGVKSRGKSSKGGSHA